MLKLFADVITHDLLGLDTGSGLGAAVHFFVYDSVKIVLMLLVMISFIGFLRTYVSQEKMRAWLAGKGILGNVVAASFGALTPFCSCSSIPIFLGFMQAGVPLGVAFSFLITSPLINEYLAVLMLGFFGLKITVLYIVSGLVIGVTCGFLMGKMKLDRYLVRHERHKSCCSGSGGCGTGKPAEPVYSRFVDRVVFGLKEALSILKKLSLWIFLGIGIGALIHGYIPSETIQAAVSKAGPFSVPIAVLLGVPMYGSCASIVPVAVVLFKKGVPLGTALAFMMATSALSLPEAILLRSAMKIKLIAIFFGIVILGIVLTGYLFNYLQVLP